MKTIVITGCSTGFGRGAAERFAARGDRVYATMRNTGGKNREAAESLRSLAEAEGWALRVLDLDVTSDASVTKAASAVLDASGAPDVVINNAGQMYCGVTEAFTAEEFTSQLDLNVVGIHRMCRAFLPAMRENGGGLIVNLSSIAGRMAVPFFGLYHASKWGVEGYSLATRRELACTGIDVVVVEPGPFTTQLFPQAPAPTDAEGRAASYPDVVQQTFEGMGAAFQGMFDDPEVPTDPELVVDRFVELVDMAPGTRPFRSVVGVDLGVAERNVSTDAHEGPFLEMLGLSDFTELSA